MPNLPVNALFGQQDPQTGNALQGLNYYARNLPYSTQTQGFQTQLSPQEEAAFQNWVKSGNVPFNPSPQADYDMRGFFKGLISGDPAARQQINPNDHQMHYGDKWKTPYHKSFSNESQWATPNAPAWNAQDQLVLPNGQVVYDERAK